MHGDRPTPIFTDGVELVVLSTAPMAACWAGFARLYSRFVDVFGSDLRLWRDADMENMEDVGPADLERLPAWLASAASAVKTGSFGLHLQHGRPDTNPTPPSFEFFFHNLDTKRPRAGARIAFPLASDPDELVEFAAQAVAELPLSYGFCGLSLCWNSGYSEVDAQFGEWALPRLRRYPGLGLGDLLPYVLHAPEGLLSIGWLTLLGREYTEALGGLNGLRAAVDAGTAVQSLPGGRALLRIGEAPALGDLEGGDPLPEYQKVGGLLAPIRVSDALIRKMNLIVMHGAEKERWLRRFFG